MRARILLWAMPALLASTVIALPPADAARARNLSLDELVNGSSVIAVVRVDQSAGEWQEGRILTRHDTTVEELWSGRADTRIDIATLGGVVGDIGQRVSGQVTLRPGDRLAVFLVWDPTTGAHRLRGGSNGVLRIVNALDGIARVRGDLVPSPLTGTALPGLDELRQQVLEVKRDR